MAIAQPVARRQLYGAHTLCLTGTHSYTYVQPPIDGDGGRCGDEIDDESTSESEPGRTCCVRVERRDICVVVLTARTYCTFRSIGHSC